LNEDRTKPNPPGASAPPETPGPEAAGGSWDLLEEEPRQNYNGELSSQTDSRDERGYVPWTGLDVFTIVGLVVLSFIGALIVIEVLLALVLTVRPDLDRTAFADSAITVTVLMVMQWAITVGVALTYLKIRGYRLSPYVLGFRRTRVGSALLWLLLILIGNGIVQQIYDLVVEALTGPGNLPSDVPSQDVTALYGTSVLAVILTFTAVALITPVVEELFFRGIIHRGLEHSLGFLPGAAISSTIFALAHLDYRLFFPIFVLGFGFAFIVHRTGSIWPSIGGHFVINCLGVIAQYANLGDS